MLPKEELKERNIKFWEAFKQAMKKTSSASGRRINWANYPTELKDIYLRLETDGKGARLCFDIQPKDEDVRSILWEQMTELKVVMENSVGPGIWEEFNHTISGRNVSRIYWENKDLNFYNDEDTEEIIEFFKGKLIGFDEFYQEFKDILINLAE